MIRHGRADDLALLPAIEMKAGALFADAGLGDVVDHEPGDVEYIETFMRAGAVHVAVDAGDKPVGFALTGLLDGVAHLYELAVDPAYGRQGLGRRLVVAAFGYAQSKGCRAVTLSTFRDLNWNGPFYASLGFYYLTRAEWTAGMHLLRLREMDVGLPVERRAFMRREV